MDWIIFGFVVVWLGIISWFDIRKNEIPNSLWVILPLIGACAFQAWQGDWRLVLLAIMVAAISERERLSQLLHSGEIGKLFIWLPMLLLGLIFAVQSSPIAAFAIVGFWIAWELNWWGGADAVAALTLILIYPKGTFILAFLGVHGIAALVLTISSLWKTKTIKLHQIPGLPLLLLAILSYQIVQCYPL